MLLSALERHRARILVLLTAVSLTVFLLHFYTTTAFPGPNTGLHSTSHSPSTHSPQTPQTPQTQQPPPQTLFAPGPGGLALPSEYYSPASPDSAFCQDRFGLQHLKNARDTAASYCSPDSHSALTCFWSRTADDRADAMCFGTAATWNADRRRFRLGCMLQDPDGAPAVPRGLTKYWYGTGPGNVVNEAVEFKKQDGAGSGAAAGAGAKDGAGRRVSVLVHREGSHNLWHSLMEIMSTSWSIDVLRLANAAPANSSDTNSDTDTNTDSNTDTNAAQEPFLTGADADSTQIVLLDDHADGPYIDLWRLFAKLPIIRFKDLSASSEPSSTDIVIPFAGGSNPLWQGDWTDLSCHDTPLVKTFIARTLSHLGIDPTPPRAPNVSVTFITRTTTRRLLREDAHVAALRAAIPHMTLTVVDFAGQPLREQLEAVRRTDLLVGVHGAGLTHLMFLQAGSGVVEILPEGFQHKGFRNLAQMLGHGYFRTHARKVHKRGDGYTDENGGKEDGYTDENEEKEDVSGGDGDGVDGGEKRDRVRKGRLRARDWQSEDVEISEEALLAVVGAGVKSLYSKSLRSFDVS